MSRIEINGMKVDYISPQFENGKESNSTVYSDRLLQWDYDKYNELCRKHFGNEGQYWGERCSENIEAFLRDYIDDEKLILCRVEELEDASNGYPYWRFDYISKKK